MSERSIKEEMRELRMAAVKARYEKVWASVSEDVRRSTMEYRARKAAKWAEKKNRRVKP